MAEYITIMNIACRSYQAAFMALQQEELHAADPSLGLPSDICYLSYNNMYNMYTHTLFQECIYLTSVFELMADTAWDLSQIIRYMLNLDSVERQPNVATADIPEGPAIIMTMQHTSARCQAALTALLPDMLRAHNRNMFLFSDANYLLVNFRVYDVALSATCSKLTFLFNAMAAMAWAMVRLIRSRREQLQKRQRDVAMDEQKDGGA
jgi:hypothetical protein